MELIQAMDLVAQGKNQVRTSSTLYYIIKTIDNKFTKDGLTCISWAMVLLIHTILLPLNSAHFLGYQYRDSPKYKQKCNSPS